uniref:Uncharacterized protein n=1 Tax=Rhizophora mucronata TaxID=61149 RepID=A0A2P2PZ88_RHIMU
MRKKVKKSGRYLLLLVEFCL